MAVMTSPQPEGVLLPQKPAPMESSLAGDEQPPTSNGVNGHPSPIATPPASKSDADVTRKANSLSDMADTAAPPETNQTQNIEAFASNQSITEPAATEEPTPQVEKDPSPSAVPSAVPSAGPSAEPEKAAPPRATEQDIEMADANAASATAEKQSDVPAVRILADAAAELAQPPAVPAEKSDATRSTAADAQEDIDMGNTETQPQSSGADFAESTQVTEMSDAPVAPSADDMSLHPPSISSLAIENSQDQVSAAATADTSMIDVQPQSAVKVSREREEDDAEEERSAKRARTAEAQDEGAQQAGDGPATALAGDAMAEDAPASGPVVASKYRLQRDRGPPGRLGDPDEEKNPLSQYAMRELRRVMAQVKKTKAGGVFKDPVKDKWPGLWEQYSAKVRVPTDIGTIETKLRSQQYPTLADFVEEVHLLYENSVAFNGPDHDVSAQGKYLVENIFNRIASIPAQEPAKAEKKEPKQQATRQTEPRVATQARRESRGAAVAPPADEEVVEPLVVAIPANGVPIIRRDSTKNDGDRPKRPIHPPKNKDLGYEPKNLKKKKMSPEFRFCEEVMKRLNRSQNWEVNQWFQRPVDPVKDGVPTYHKIIKKPMDLGTMVDKLNMGEYNSTKEFENDFQLIVKNCKKFNGVGNAVTDAVEKLEAIFNEKWKEKDEWMAQHAPAPAQASSPSAAAREDSDDEAGASEQEPEEDEPPTSETLQALTERWAEENKRMAALVASSNALDMTMIPTQQKMMDMLLKQITDEKKRLAEEKAKKPAKAKASKPKKPAGAAAASSSSKKASGGAGGGGAAKKAGGSAAKKGKARVMGQVEKDAVTAGINNLEGSQLEKAIEIIKKDTNQEESESGELELDIDQLSQDALAKLYDLTIKAFPYLKPKAQKHKAAPEPAPAPIAKHATKPKKHKPMGKAEQERSIEKLREIKAQFQRPGSGSQEPLPSVEGAMPSREDDSDDDSDADSEEE